MSLLVRISSVRFDISLARGPARFDAHAFALGLAFALFLGCTASHARAHAPPEVQRIVWKNERELLLVSNRGLMFGSLDRSGLRLMCNEALHINNTEVPSIAYRKDDGLLAATSGGLFLSTDQGCSWQPVAPFTASFVSALAQMPSDPDTLWVATFGAGSSAIHVSHDGGRAWALLAQLADRDYTQSLQVASRDGALLYATGTVLVAAPSPHTTQYVARSTNAGKLWERTEIALQPGELNLMLLAVNPARPDELLMRVSSASPGLDPERLLLSRDGGKTVSSVLSLAAITGATFAADGSAAWVSSPSGIYRAEAPFDDFQRSGGADRLTCIHFHEGELWTCGHYDALDPLRDGLGRTPDSYASSFTTFMNFSDVDAPIACPDGAASAAICLAPFQDFESEVQKPNDAGVAAEPTLSAPDAALAPTSDAGDEGADDPDATAMIDRAGHRSRAASCALSAWTPRSGAQLGWLVLAGLVARLRRQWLSSRALRRHHGRELVCDLAARR